jgi:RND family efflux transporter MFP subunit
MDTHSGRIADSASTEDASSLKREQLQSRLHAFCDDEALKTNSRSGLPTFGVFLGAGLAALVLALIVLVVIGRPAHSEETSASDEAASAAAGPRAPATGQEVVAAGYVVARRQATVAAEVTGRVVEVFVDEGERVRAGQTLALLDDRTVRAEQSSSEARVVAAAAAIAGLQSDLAEAERVLERASSLRDRGYVSVADLTSKEARVVRLQADLAQARAGREAVRDQANQLRFEAGRYRIRAPFDGVVIDTTARPGEVISPISAGGGFTRTGICTIVDMSSLEVEVEVNESSIGRLARGQPAMVTLNAYPLRPRRARVTSIIPAVSRERATVRVRLAFEQITQEILPNMGARVTISTASPT